MPRAIWTGTLSFGLVSIPIRLYNATSPRDVRFHQFEAGTGRRIRLRRVVPGEDEAAQWEPGDREERGEGPARTEPAPPEEAPVSAGSEASIPFERVVKGYEVDRDRYVLVTPEELEALAPEQTRTIEIEDFVELADIDPVYFEKSYYLAPQRGGEKPYALLLRAMADAGKVAIARFVLRSREHLAAIRPMEGVIALETLFYADEVRSPKEIGLPAGRPMVAERELAMARQLIESLVTEWDPARYADTYRERVLELIEAKARGEELVTAEPPSEPPAVPDLMAALKASVEAAKGRRAAARSSGTQPDRAARRPRSGAG
jgi:DNA end-binding protein Ku